MCFKLAKSCARRARFWSGLGGDFFVSPKQIKNTAALFENEELRLKHEESKVRKQIEDRMLTQGGYDSQDVIPLISRENIQVDAIREWHRMTTFEKLSFDDAVTKLLGNPPFTEFGKV